MAGSLDVEAPYPSIYTKVAARECRNRVADSTLQFEVIDFLWALLYLAATMTPCEKVDPGLQGGLPCKKNKQGAKATARTISMMTTQDLKKWWLPKPIKTLDECEKKMILGCHIEQMVNTGFSSHFYMWDGTIQHQEEGAPWA